MTRLMARLWREYNTILARLEARIRRENTYTNFPLGLDLLGIQRPLLHCSLELGCARAYCLARCGAMALPRDGPQRLKCLRKKRSNRAPSKGWCLIQRMSVPPSLVGWGWTLED